MGLACRLSKTFFIAHFLSTKIDHKKTGETRNFKATNEFVMTRERQTSMCEFLPTNKNPEQLVINLYNT